MGGDWCLAKTIESVLKKGHRIRARVRWNDRSFPNRMLETYRSYESRTKHTSRTCRRGGQAARTGRTWTARGPGKPQRPTTVFLGFSLCFESGWRQVSGSRTISRVSAGKKSSRTCSFARWNSRSFPNRDVWKLSRLEILESRDETRVAELCVGRRSALDEEVGKKKRYVYDAFGDRLSKLTCLLYLNDDFKGGCTARAISASWAGLSLSSALVRVRLI